MAEEKLVEFYAFETIGIPVTNINAVARCNLDGLDKDELDNFLYELEQEQNE